MEQAQLVKGFPFNNFLEFSHLVIQSHCSQDSRELTYEDMKNVRIVGTMEDSTKVSKEELGSQTVCP